MVRRELLGRKLQLIVEDLHLLVQFKDESLATLKSDEIRLAAVERLLERIVMRAIDINEHLLSELWSGEGKSTRLTYRDTFLMLADLGVGLIFLGVRPEKPERSGHGTCLAAIFRPENGVLRLLGEARPGEAGFM